MATKTLSKEEKAAASVFAAALEKCKRTQEDIGADVGVTQGTIWQWANGRMPITAKRAAAVAKAVGVADPATISVEYRRLMPPKVVVTRRERGDDSTDHLEKEIQALRIAVRSLVITLSVTMPPTAAAWKLTIEKNAEEQGFDIHTDLLGSLLSIVDEAQNEAGAASPRALRHATAVRTRQ